MSDRVSAPRYPLWQSVVAGGTAGLLNDTVLHPIDTLRARLNVNHAGHPVPSWESPLEAATTELRRTMTRYEAAQPPCPGWPCISAARWIPQLLRGPAVRPIAVALRLHLPYCAERGRGACIEDGPRLLYLQLRPTPSSLVDTPC